MQSQEEFTRSNDRRDLIVKGKRTKRQRSSSPFGVTVTSSSSSGGGSGDTGVVAPEEYNSISSPTTSDEIYESTEEEEEMANCLIMLAQSDGPKRHIEAKFDIATTINKGGIYVYECKTCNRSFPSFQALGGHMASHKKPKSAIPEHKRPLVLAVNDAVIAFRSATNRKGSNKIHECSICGSEFTSGQALGGHMRRHRVAAAASNESAVNVDTTISINSSKLLLDLNLPAPDDDDDDHRDKPQQAIVFCTAALVDCHY